jgi:hypothetical protein
MLVGAAVLAVTAGAVLATHGGSGRAPSRTSARGAVALANTGVAATGRIRGRKVLSGSPTYGFLQFDGVSPAVRDLPTVSAPPLRPRSALPNEGLIRGLPGRVADPVMQTAPGNAPAPAPSLVFDSMCDGFGTACPPGPSECSCLPPDTVGEVGATQYVSAVNNSFAVFDKTNGAVLKAATTVRSLWPSGICAAAGNSDPIVLYDQLAGRWFLSILEVQSLGASTNALCIAISKTGDAMGQYWLYTFDTGATLMDYPKYGVWPNAYYGTANEFPANAQLSTGVAAFAFERPQMLIGAPARYVTYDEGAPCPQGTPLPTCGYGFFAGQLPADLDGSTAPPSAPGLIVAVDDPSSLPGGAPPSPPGAPGWNLRIWKYSVDWSTHPNPTTTFGVGANHDADFVVPVAMFARTQCVYGHPPASCIPQSDAMNAGPAPEGLDVLGDRLMNRAAYRNFGDRQSLVLNLSVVSADPNNPTATRISPRWMEVRNPSGISGSPTIYQQSTYALVDTVQHPLWRWMGSIAQDAVGDIALGYSASGPLDFPSIRYSGQLASKLPGSLNTLTESETVVVGSPTYNGPQTEPQGRWGDYSDMTIDPVDDCTFWYTQEYLEPNVIIVNDFLGDWRTRVARFKLNPDCAKPTAVAVAHFGARWTKTGVSLSWRTATETELAGFNLWRSSSKSWRKVNQALIAAKQTGRAAGAAYRLLDRSSRPRGSYTYRLQVVDLNGKRSWYGPGAVPAR